MSYYQDEYRIKDRLSFTRFQGFVDLQGQIIDVSLVPFPVQRNTREKNKSIKQGEIPEA